MSGFDYGAAINAASQSYMAAVAEAQLRESPTLKWLQEERKEKDRKFGPVYGPPIPDSYYAPKTVGEFVHLLSLLPQDAPLYTDDYEMGAEQASYVEVYEHRDGSGYIIR